MDKATGELLRTLIKMQRGEIYGSPSNRNQEEKEQTSQDINQHKLLRQKRFFRYDNENSDAIDDWRDVLDDKYEYKKDLVDMFRDGARTFLETFFPCGVTDTCDKDEPTTPKPKPMPMTTKKPTYYYKSTTKSTETTKNTKRRRPMP